MRPDCFTIGKNFRIDGEFLTSEPWGSGHINNTYRVIYQQSKVPVKYILQRINHHVFNNPVGLMQNINRVIDHQKKKLLLEKDSDISRNCLTLIHAQDGKPYYQDQEGCYWRTYCFIENTCSYDIIQSPQQAYETAKAFGRFQKRLTDLPSNELVETIPDFHNTPKRFNDFVQAVNLDAHNRAIDCQKEIKFAEKRQSITHRLLDLHKRGDIPQRITHNDTKLNNVLFDKNTQKGVCVIDLDTIMPGLTLYDFGDLVRTSTNPVAEDEQDLSKVNAQMDIFEALTKGYLEAVGRFLNPAEKSCMVFSGKLITLELGLRFLTDHLNGDLYFPVMRKGHNLDRCKTQFRLMASLESQENAMNRIVESLCG
ncbi:MAG: aminoglycoside phosphotransferase family protein [SAR324 cluster bacterium]|nr:aminoglycoside phosphotransferase family protein [SAR324 cluster bacterium]